MSESELIGRIIPGFIINGALKKSAICKKMKNN